MALGSLALLQGEPLSPSSGIACLELRLLPGHACASAWSASTWSTTGRSPRRSIWWGTTWGASLGGLYLHPLLGARGLWGLVLGIELVLIITAGLRPLARSLERTCGARVR